MKRYSIENIYFYSGQFDRVVTITFGQNTDAIKKYGRTITASLHYTKNEREELEEIIKTDPIPFTDGKVKFKDLLYPLPKDLKDELFYEGVLASEIVEILYFNKPVKNQFAEKGIRELPEPIELQFDASGMDIDKFTLNLYNRFLETDYNLTPDEVNEYNALTYKLFKDKMSEKDLALYLDSETGKIRDELQYIILDGNSKNGKLSDLEREEYERLVAKRMSERTEILKKELIKSTEKFKQLGINYEKELRLLHALSYLEKPGRLSSNKFPVWWDFERFVHIFLRHVTETQIGERNVGKETVFQYKLSDIKDLLQIILKKIDEDIQNHFKARPNVEFTKKGIHYNGDYYNIRIAPSGKLMMFHKS